jgi:hypothetical protein
MEAGDLHPKEVGEDLFVNMNGKGTLENTKRTSTIDLIIFSIMMQFTGVKMDGNHFERNVIWYAYIYA